MQLYLRYLVQGKGHSRDLEPSPSDSRSEFHKDGLFRLCPPPIMSGDSTACPANHLPLCQAPFTAAGPSAPAGQGQAGTAARGNCLGLHKSGSGMRLKEAPGGKGVGLRGRKLCSANPLPAEGVGRAIIGTPSQLPMVDTESC